MDIYVGSANRSAKLAIPAKALTMPFSDKFMDRLAGT